MVSFLRCRGQGLSLMRDNGSQPTLMALYARLWDLRDTASLDEL